MFAFFLASFTPTLMDLYLLYSKGFQASALVLGAILATILLIYGAIWVWITYFKK